MFRQIIDGKALADVMETWQMWVIVSETCDPKTLKIDCPGAFWKDSENVKLHFAGCVVFKKIQHENPACQKSTILFFQFT